MTYKYEVYDAETGELKDDQDGFKAYDDAKLSGHLVGDYLIMSHKCLAVEVEVKEEAE